MFVCTSVFYDGSKDPVIFSMNDGGTFPQKYSYIYIYNNRSLNNKVLVGYNYWKCIEQNIRTVHESQETDNC